MKNVWVTGASGFLGKSIQKIASLKDFVLFIDKIDLYNYGEIVKYLKLNNINMIVNTASIVGGIEFNLNNPVTMISDNSYMYLNLMRAAKEVHIEKLINVGSICAYGRNSTVPFSELNLFDGSPEESNRFYGNSKRLLLELGLAYNKQYKMNIVNPILTNLYGMNDHFENNRSHVIPSIIKKIYNAKKNSDKFVLLMGDGTPTREMLYVEDAAEAIIFLLENHNDSQPINIGSNKNYTIKEISNKIKSIIGFSGEINWDSSKPNGQMKREVDSSKINNLGWKAKTDLDTGLEKTIKWFIENEIKNEK